MDATSGRTCEALGEIAASAAGVLVYLSGSRDRSPVCSASATPDDRAVAQLIRDLGIKSNGDLVEGSLVRGKP